MKRTISQSSLIILLSVLFIASHLRGQDIIDLSDPGQNLQAFVKTRAALDGSEVVFWWSGTIHSFIPGERGIHLFNFEGFNVARIEQVEQGYILLSREAAFYKDRESDAILESWDNPLSGKTNRVIHVWNDPVNQNLFLKSRYGPFTVPTTLMGEDLYWHMEIFLNYPSPLPRSRYPQYSGSDEYQAAELFQYYTRFIDIIDQNKTSVPCQISWNRISPWLPWMEMADRPGYLVYHCHGKKLENGFDDLPRKIKDYVLQHQPQFRHAPEQYSDTNETSWTYFKKLLQEGKIKQPPSAPKF